MKTLVTCAAGFVGVAFTQAVRGLNRPVRTWVRDPAKADRVTGTELIVGDLFDPKVLRRALEGVDIVIHVPPRVYPTGSAQMQLAAHRRVHFESTRRLVEAAAQEGVRRFLYISSAHAGGRDAARVLCETDAARPCSPYGMAKREAEIYLDHVRAVHGWRVVILRPPSIYGGDGDKGLLTPLKKAAVHGIPLPLKGLDTRHSLVFVEDLARAGIALLDAPDGAGEETVFAIKDPTDYTPQAMFTACCAGYGKTARMFRCPAWLLRRIGPFAGMLASQRYCGHRFAVRCPDFRFTPLAEACAAIAHM